MEFSVPEMAVYTFEAVKLTFALDGIINFLHGLGLLEGWTLADMTPDNNVTGRLE
jgi:hypothetical protein